MPIGLFGGTFDPIHKGHLRIAFEILQLLNLSQLRFIPSYLPPHRNQPSVSADHRAAMLDLAIEEEPRFICDRREILRSGMSYTIDTLTDVRKELGSDANLIFLMGRDVLHGIHSWKHWDKLLEYVHLVIIDRPGYSEELSYEVDEWLQKYQIRRASDLQLAPCGSIYSVSLNALEVSATEVRGLLARKLSVQHLLPAKVATFVEEKKLYATCHKVNDHLRRFGES